MTRRIVSMEEQDAYTGWRRVMFWQRGELRRIKRRTAKRERREADRATRQHMRDWQSGAFTHKGEDDD